MVRLKGMALVQVGCRTARQLLARPSSFLLSTIVAAVI